jgi:hypothetical protein
MAYPTLSTTMLSARRRDTMGRVFLDWFSRLGRVRIPMNGKRRNRYTSSPPVWVVVRGVWNGDCTARRPLRRLSTRREEAVG